MALVNASPAIETWLDRDAQSWELVSDSDYRALVERWHKCFASLVAGSDAVQGPRAPLELDRRLPDNVYLLNGFAVPRASVSGAQHPCAYRATNLQAVDAPAANTLDLVLVDQAFSYCCVFTHEWQALAHPIFAERAA